MIEDMRKMWESLSGARRRELVSEGDQKAAWRLWWMICADRQHNEEHPRWRKPYNHKRVLEYDPGFSPFSGVSDRELGNKLLAAFLALDKEDI